MVGKTASPDTSKFETFILLVRLVFEPELFKPPIGISVFGLETRITRPIAFKICTKKDSYVPHLNSKFQVSIFSRFKVIAFFISAAEFVIFSRKNIKTSDAKRRRIPKKLRVILESFTLMRHFDGSSLGLAAVTAVV